MPFITKLKQLEMSMKNKLNDFYFYVNIAF